MIGGEVHFVARLRSGFRAGHHPCVVDEYVKRPIPRGDERCDRFHIGDVELCYVQRFVAGVRSDGQSCTFASGDISYSQSDLRADAGKRSRRFKTDTGGGAGDYRATATEIDTRGDLGSSA